MDCANVLKNAASADRANLKQRLARKLHEEEGLVLDLCEETLDLLAAALFGEEVKKDLPERKACPSCGTVVAAVIANVYGIFICFSGDIRSLWPVVLIIFTSSVLSFFGWKKKSNMLLITGSVFYLFSLNFISFIIFVIAILWDNEDEFNMREKKKNSLFVIAGIFAVFGLLIWLIPLTGKAEGSSVHVPLYQPADETTGTIPPVDSSLRQFSMFTRFIDSIPDRVMGLNFAIGFLAASVLALAISFVGKLRNNPKKALLAAVFYIFSLSVFSAILCFIGYVSLKKRSAS